MISTRRMPFIRPFVLLVVTLAALPAVALELSPLARPVPAQVWDKDYLDRQAGLFEAEIKSRMVDKAMQADPGATAGMDDYDVIAYDLVMDVDGGGDIAVTFAAAIQGANTVATFGDAGDFVRVVGAQVGGALVWRLVVNDGTALS